MERLRNQLNSLGANPDHARRVLRHWVQAIPQDAGRRRIEDFCTTHEENLRAVGISDWRSQWPRV